MINEQNDIIKYIQCKNYNHYLKVGNLESQAKLLKTQCDSYKSALSKGESHKIWCFG